MASLAPTLAEQLAESERGRRRLLDSLPALLATPFGPQQNILDTLLRDADEVQQYDYDEHPIDER